ncbi:MAG: serine protease, partial [Planctomycetota bacterium]
MFRDPSTDSECHLLNGGQSFTFRFLVFLVFSLLVGTAFASANHYQQVLSSTTWIITSDADNETSTGTGVLIDAEKRLVLTNAHVVGDSRTAVVFFPEMSGGMPRVKRKYYLDNVVKLAQPSKVVAVDRKRDLALIQLPKLPSGAKAIDMSETSVMPGSDIDVIGNPGGSDVLWVTTSGTVRSVYDKKFKSNHGRHEFR